MGFQRGLAVLNMLLFVLLFTILSGTLLALVSSQTRLMETHIRRVKGYYASEANTVAALDSLKRNVSIVSQNIDWYHSLAGTTVGTKPVVVTNLSAVGPAGTMQINATTDYASAW